jgi:hypothetical protein
MGSKSQKLNLLAFLMLTLFLLDGCTVYHKQACSVSESLEIGGSAKMITNSDQVLKFYSLQKSCSPPGYIGGYRDKGKPQCFHVDTAIVEAIYLKDYKRSKRQSMWLVGTTGTLGFGMGVGLYILLIKSMFEDLESIPWNIP